MTQKGKVSIYGYEVLFSLKQVAETTQEDRPLRFREFLDQFYLASDADRPDMIEAEPPLTGDEVWDVYLAATAEHLSRKAGIEVPLWALSRRLEKPFFAATSDEMRLILLVQSPTAFRRRNIFISSDGLDRATTPEKWRGDPGWGFVDARDRSEDRH